MAVAFFRLNLRARKYLSAVAVVRKEEKSCASGSVNDVVNEELRTSSMSCLAASSSDADGAGAYVSQSADIFFFSGGRMVSLRWTIGRSGTGKGVTGCNSGCNRTRARFRGLVRNNRDWGVPVQERYLFVMDSDRNK